MSSDMTSLPPATCIWLFNSACTLLQLSHLLWFIIYREHLNRGEKLRLSSIFSPINRVLVFTFTSFILGDSAQVSVGILGDSFLPTGAVLASLAICLQEICILYYSWIRSRGIVEQVTPSLHPKFEKFVSIAPFLFTTQVVATALNQFLPTSLTGAKDISGILEWTFSILCGLSAILSDSTFLYVFVKYLRQINDEVKVVDSKFSIIAKHGVAAEVAMYCSFCLIVSSYWIKDNATSRIVASIGGIFINIVAGVLVHMKIAILTLPNSKDKSTHKPSDRESRSLRKPSEKERFIEKPSQSTIAVIVK